MRLYMNIMDEKDCQPINLGSDKLDIVSLPKFNNILKLCYLKKFLE